MDYKDTKQLKDNFETVLILEYLGVHFENMKNNGHKTSYYFSVPEKSEIDIDDDSLKNHGKSYNDLIYITKNCITEMIVNTCKSQFEKDEDFEDLLEFAKENISDFVSFYTKIRYGEVWTVEKGKAAAKKISSETRNSLYIQV